MNWRLLLLEFTLLRRERRVWWSLVALALLVVGACLVTAQEQIRGSAAKADIAAAERQRWLGQGVKDPHSAAHYSIYALKTSPALSLLDPGVDPYVGQAVWLEAHHQNDGLYRTQDEAPVLQREGLANPAALLISIAPLFAFLLAFRAVALERERGTLRLALGVGTAPLRLIALKATACVGVLVLLLIVPVGLLGAAFCVREGTFSTDTTLRLALWCMAMTVYFVIVVMIGMIVAARITHGRAALATLFGLWTVLVLALPRWASDAVAVSWPLPSTQSVQQALQERAPAYWSAEQGASQHAALLARHGVQRKEDLPVDLRGAELDMAERHSHDVFDEVLGGFYDQVSEQDLVHSLLGWISPAIAMQSLSPALVGSDFAHHREFIDTAERYRRDLVNRMNAAVMKPVASAGAAQPAGDAALWSQVPEFRHSRPALWTAPTALPALVTWLVAGVLLLAVTLRRLRP
ncbi:MAG: DUF3526 domain-containing protein [Rhodanobacteraceae bacterium]|nr:DUF3526 domain-containing protein [Rhodanobacteraceae bacterium]